MKCPAEKGVSGSADHNCGRAPDTTRFGVRKSRGMYRLRQLH